MDKLLVTRPETLIGAAALATLGPRLNIVGGHAPDAGSLRNTVLDAAPQLVVHTGPFSVAGWDVGGLGLPSLTNQIGGAAELDLALQLAATCREVNAKLIVVVTDGMFAGPHMFHNENARPNAVGPFARHAATIERKLVGSGALVVRSHAYGWCPGAFGMNYAERMFHELTGELPCPVDAVRHATPILATDLAERLYEAYRLGLSGLMHITGAERTSPYRFAAELAAALGVPGRFVQLTAKPESGSRINVEETTLNTMAFRRATKRPLPMLREGLARFAEQAFNGYRRQIGAAETAPREMLEPQAA